MPNLFYEVIAFEKLRNLNYDKRIVYYISKCKVAVGADPKQTAYKKIQNQLCLYYQKKLMPGKAQYETE